jgi:hypothetical protein
MARATRWVVIWNDPNTNLPACLTGPAGANCAAHGRALNLMRQVLDTKALASAQLTSFLDSAKDTLVEWRALGIVGSTKWISADQVKGMTPETLANGLTSLAKESCRDARNFNTRQVDPPASDRAAQGFWCRADGGLPETITAYRADGGFYIVAMRANGPDTSALDTVTRTIMRRLPGIPAI